MTQLFDRLPIGAYRSTVDGRQVRANPALARLNGYASEAEMLAAVADIGAECYVDPARRARFAELMARDGQVLNFESEVYRHKTRHTTGERRWVREHAYAVRQTADGPVVWYEGTVEDITAEVQARQAALDSARRLRALTDNAQVLTLVCDAQARVLHASPAAQRLLGHPPEQLLGTCVFDWLHPDDVARAQVEIAEVVGNRHPGLESINRVRHADGRWRRLASLGSNWLHEPAVQGIVLNFRDVTEAQAAEQALRELNGQLEERVAERTRQLRQSEARFRRIFESVPVAILEQDWSAVRSLLHEPAVSATLARAEGAAAQAEALHGQPALLARCQRSVHIRRLNPAARQLYGVGTAAGDGSATQLTLDQVFAQFEPTTSFVDELVAFHRGDPGLRTRVVMRRPDGQRLDLLITLAMPEPDDITATVLVSVVDVTELNRLGRELDASLQRARQTNRELETFTYSVSHDLKAPLRGLAGYSQLLLQDHADALNDEGRMFVGHIGHAARQMGLLIDDLLAYSRLERRPQVLASAPLGPLIAPLLAPYADELAARGMPALQLPAALQQPGLQVRVDPQGLALALRNLVDNALKFSGHSASPQVTLGGQVTEHSVVLWLQDNGLGFDMKYHDRIFEIFQRLQRAEDYPGTGVGLAIVRKAMQRMGGRVWAHSAPGQGATFHLEMPRA